MDHRQFWLETQDAADEFCQKNPSEAKRLLAVWVGEDPCLASLHMFCLACSRPEQELRDRFQQIINKHWQACGRCRPKVLTVSETAKEPLKRAVYREAVMRFDQTLAAVKGANSKVEERPEGRYFRLSRPEGSPETPDRPFSALERFSPKDPNDGGYWLFEVKSKKLFDNPRPLLQHIDATASDEVQFFPPEASYRHWRPIRGDQAERLLIRWNGQVKEVAPDWSVGARYEGMLDRDLPREPYHQEVPPDGARERALGDHALVLEQAALAYTDEKRQKANFSGFLWSKARYTAMTARSEASEDPLAIAQPVADDPEGEEDDEPTAAQPFDVHAKEGWDADEPHRGQNIDLSILISRVRPKLSERQREVLRLHLQQLTDATIAKRLKCRRETVVRDRKKIVQLMKQSRIV